MFWFLLPSGFAPRATLGFVLSLVVLVVGLFGWVGMRIAEDGERLRADREAVRAMWTGAELVRICARGQEIYRLDGRLVTGVRGWSIPQQFAADVAPEAACSR